MESSTGASSKSKEKRMPFASAAVRCSDTQRLSTSRMSSGDAAPAGLLLPMRER